jgi:predicted dehydrogenase
MIRDTRRTFLKQTAAAATLLPSLSSSPWAAPLGANDRIRICVMGVRQRGRQQIDTFLKIPEVEIACICDVDEAVGRKQVERIQEATGKAPRLERDIRRVLEDRSLDAVSIATPNHWHSLAAIWACQAGKDVLVEKPLSHNLFEGRKLVEAARHSGRIVQHTTQYRSAPGIRAGIEFLRQGKLGRVTLARALIYKPKGGIGTAGGEQPIPPGVDYDLWLGPAPNKPLTRKKLHYDWHWLWDYGNGEIGNQGVHMIDICRWGLGQRLPRTALCCGGRFGPPDDGEIPETQVALLDYGDCQMLVEVRCLPSPAFGDTNVHIGEIFYGSEGHLVIGHYGDATAYLGKDKQPLVLGEPLTKPPGKPSATDYDQGHFRNFLAALRSRKTSDLFADVEEGHLTCCHVHLANMSYRLGKQMPFDPRRAVFSEDSDASDAFQRLQEHLADNRLLMKDTTYRLGRTLKFDTQSETIPGDAEAALLATRSYRQPFVVPDKVA